MMDPPVSLRQLLSGVVVIKADFDYPSRRFTYLGTGSAFDEVEPWCTVPTYDVMCDENNIFSFKKENNPFSDLQSENIQLKLELEACRAVASGEKNLTLGGPALLAVRELREQYERATTK